MNEVSAIILAGGRSSRMGTDKAMLDIGGLPLLLHLANQVRSLGLECTIVLSPADPARAVHYQALVPWASFVFDRESGRGPVAGIEAGAGAAKTPWIFLLSCDIPDLALNLLSKMWHLACRPLPTGSLPVAVYVAGEPFHGLYRRDVAYQTAKKLLEETRPAARTWLRQLRPARILPRSLATWRNLNTLEDYRRYRQLFDDSP